jgi:rhodanese-related sulfurtransferase
MNPSTATTPTGIPEVDPQTAVRLIGEGAVLLDVREPAEWAAGHSPNAQHLPLASVATETLPPGRLVVAVCRSGARSAKAAAMLAEAGVEVRNLTGGMTAWAAAGLPVVGGDGRPGIIA